MEARRPTNNEPFGIDQDPFLLNFRRLLYEGGHDVKSLIWSP